MSVNILGGGSIECIVPNSRWYLLGDGRVMLAEYNEGALAPFGLDEARLTSEMGYRMTSGALFAPNGTCSFP